MAKNSKDAYGANGKTNVLKFEPEKLHLVTDKAHPLYDERVHLPIDKGMVLNIRSLVFWSRSLFGKTLKTGLPVWLLAVSAFAIRWKPISCC
nr:Uncharacterised protein [Raoultella sp. NCTC 9187]